VFWNNEDKEDTGLTDEDLFYEEVGNHEQLWGRSGYEGRPSLREIMHAKIVAIWYPVTPKLKMNPQITVHEDLQPIHDFAAAFMVHSSSEDGLPKTRLARVFYEKKELKIKGVKLLFEVPDSLKQRSKNTK